MSEPANLGERRANATGDCRCWTPIECLQALIRDLQNGVIQPEQIAIHMMIRTPQGWRHDYRCAGLSFQQHIALLEVARFKTLQEWML